MGDRIVNTVFRELRYAMRQLTRTPLFTNLAVLSFGLGIGANTTRPSGLRLARGRRVALTPPRFFDPSNQKKKRRSRWELIFVRR